MSPFLVLLDAAHRGFPRVSGDEPPSKHFTGAIFAFSPRERG